MRIFFTIYIFLMICGCSTKNGQESADHQEAEVAEQTEIQLSDLKLLDLQGNEVPATTFAGKPVFINVWATWCRPCIKEMPAIAKAKEELSKEGIIFIFPSNESLDKIKKFKDTHDYNFDYYQITTGYEQLGIYSLPTTLLFNKEGQLLESIIGAQEWDSPQSIDYLRKIAN